MKAAWDKVVDQMIEIKNLHVKVVGNKILKGLNLTIPSGEVHSIMGPNGSGKSTLAQVIAGNEAFEVTEGSIEYDGQDLLELDPAERAALGIFLAFQYPVEISGVSNMQFINAAYNSQRKYRGDEEADPIAFLKLVKEKCKLVKMNDKLLSRSVNEGFSGGEKKRHEIFQMAMLAPKLAMLDETDSGLDIDALRIVADGVNSMREDGRSFLVITHYQRLLDYIVPDVVHVLYDGRIVKSGGKELALQLEERGYAWVEQEASAIAN